MSYVFPPAPRVSVPVVGSDDLFPVSYTHLDVYKRQDWDSPIALANVLMINAWIPYPNYFFSYISPSWSVSTEFFFYLTFPFLIYKWDNNRFAKLLISFLILLIMLAVSNMLQTKTLGDFENSFAKTGLLYISHVTRIFEFIFGMFIASVWKKITE